MRVFALPRCQHDVVVKEKPRSRFVPEGATHPVEQATASGGNKLVHIMGGPSIIQQAPTAGWK
jgi:hypothetical protein